jgi:hypothetical protein
LQQPHKQPNRLFIRWAITSTIPPSGVSQGAIRLLIWLDLVGTLAAVETDFGHSGESTAVRKASGPVLVGTSTASSFAQWGQQDSVLGFVATTATVANSFAHSVQHSPAKPNAAIEIITKPKLPMIAGVNRLCFRSPGTNAVKAIAKQPMAIHLWNASSAKKLNPSAGK